MYILPLTYESTVITTPLCVPKSGLPCLVNIVLQAFCPSTLVLRAFYILKQSEFDGGKICKLSASSLRVSCLGRNYLYIRSSMPTIGGGMDENSFRLIELTSITFNPNEETAKLALFLASSIASLVSSFLEFLSSHCTYTMSTIPLYIDRSCFIISWIFCLLLFE